MEEQETTTELCSNCKRRFQRARKDPHSNKQLLQDQERRSNKKAGGRDIHSGKSLESKNKLRKQSSLQEYSDQTLEKQRRNQCESKFSKRHDNSFDRESEDKSQEKASRKQNRLSKRRELNGKANQKKEKLQHRDSVIRNAKQKQKLVSQFDRIEEIRFQQQEILETLTKLNDLIKENSNNDEEENYFSANFLFSVPPEAWEEIRNLSSRTQINFSSVIEESDQIYEQLNTEITQWKIRCSNLKNKLLFIRSDSNLQNTDWVVRENEFKKSLTGMARAYEKNRTQMFNVINDMEDKVYALKNARQKLNVKHLGNMSFVEKEMDEACNFLSQSGRIQYQRLDSNREKLGGSLDGKDMDKTTPRGGLLQKAPSGQRKSGKSQREENKRSAVSIPPLPMHMLQREGVTHRGNQQLSAKLTNIKSHRSSGRNNVPLPQRDSARLGSHKKEPSYRQSGGTNRSNSQGDINNIEGAIVDGYLINPVMVAAVGYQTSRFDKNLEMDYEDANQTIDFKTDRLKQYEEEYEFLMQIEGEEQRILYKQYLFYNHEREIKKQCKVEAKQKRLLKRQQQQQQTNNNNQLGNTTPRQMGTAQQKTKRDDNNKTIKDSARSNNNKGTSKDDSLYQIMDISNIQLDSPLSSLGTQEIKYGGDQDEDELGDAKLTQLMLVKDEMEGFNLKTATQKDLIEILHVQIENQQKMYKEDRKVWEWSGKTDKQEDYEDNNSNNQKDEEKISIRGEQKLYNNNAISIIDNKSKRNENGVGKFDFNQSSNNLDNEIDQSSSSAHSSSYSELNQQIRQQQQPSARDIQQFPKQSPVFISQHIKNTIQTLHQMKSETEQEEDFLTFKKFQQKQQQQSPPKQISQREAKISERKQYPSSKRSLYQQDQDLSMMNQDKRSLHHNSFFKEDYIDSLQDEQSNSSSKQYPPLITKNSNRSKSRQDFKDNNNIDLEGINLILPIEKSNVNKNKIQSARGTPSSMKHKKTSHQNMYYGQQEEDEEHNKRDMQSAPNSQRNKIQNQKSYRGGDLIDKNKNNINNFYSIQVEDFQNDIIQSYKNNKQQQPRKTNSKNSLNNNFSNNNSMIELQQQNQQQDILTSFRQPSSNLIKHSLPSFHALDTNNFDSEVYDILQKEKDTNNKKRSIEEEIGSAKKLLMKSSSEIILRDSQRMYDINDFMNQNNNNQNINFYFGQQTADQEINLNLNTNTVLPTISLLPSQDIYLTKSSFLGGPTTHQMHQYLNNKSQISNDFLSNYYQHQTQQNFPGSSTREVPTCKKRGEEQTGSVAFSLTDSSNGTLYQFLTSNKKTLQMMQNFYNNFYHNIQAGVLFTMNGTKDIINQQEYLGNCSTVPSEPHFINGNESGIGGNKQTGIATKSNQNRIGINTDETGGRILSYQQNKITQQFQHLNDQTKQSQQNKLTLDSGLNIRRILQNNHIKASHLNFNQNTTNNSNSFTGTKVRTPNMRLNFKQQETTNASSNILINSQVSRESSTRAGKNGSLFFKGSQDTFSISPVGIKNQEKPSMVFHRNYKGVNLTTDQNNTSFQQSSNKSANGLVIKKQNFKRVGNNNNNNDITINQDNINYSSSITADGINTQKTNDYISQNNKQQRSEKSNNRIFQMAQKRIEQTRLNRITGGAPNENIDHLNL